MHDYTPDVPWDQLHLHRSHNNDLLVKHVPEGCGSCSVCVCISVCYHILDNIVHLDVTRTIAIRFTWYSLDFNKHNFFQKLWRYLLTVTSTRIIALAVV